MTVLPISVCIPVKNEAKNLPNCLRSLSDAFDDVVVVDSGSTDATVSIAKQAGAKVLVFRWDGGFPKKRNWALQNHEFRHPWVLFLDADECLTPEVIAELRAKVPGSTHAGYWISFTNWFMGRPLRHGDVFRKLALFRKDAGQYERFPESWWSHLDMEVHEHPILTGTTGVIESRLEHRDYRGLSQYIARHNEYSTWEANRWQWLSSAGAAAWQSLTSRQQFKYRNLDRWWFAKFYWFVSYVIKRGFLDGRQGLTFAAYKHRYFVDIRLKILELDLNRQESC
jgi:glycosyltransferase involved in cell wall biosynthesis